MKLNLSLFLAIALSLFLFSCNQNRQETTSINSQNQIDSIANTNAQNRINQVLDSFNIAAANADFENYFKYLNDDAVFIGTDASEVWNKKDFMVWAKPYFDRGKAWEFKSVQRHIYFDKTGNIAWFDELLDTQMKICRGSGVLTRHGNDWKIQQYVLSMTISNSLMDSVINLKSVHDDEFLKNL